MQNIITTLHVAVRRKYVDSWEQLKKIKIKKDTKTRRKENVNLKQYLYISMQMTSADKYVTEFLLYLCISNIKLH
jgi:hypothetical protein